MSAKKAHLEGNLVKIYAEKNKECTIGETLDIKYLDKSVGEARKIEFKDYEGKFINPLINNQAYYLKNQDGKIITPNGEEAIKNEVNKTNYGNILGLKKDKDLSQGYNIKVHKVAMEIKQPVLEPSLTEEQDQDRLSTLTAISFII